MGQCIPYAVDVSSGCATEGLLGICSSGPDGPTCFSFQSDTNDDVSNATDAWVRHLARRDARSTFSPFVCGYPRSFYMIGAKPRGEVHFGCEGASEHWSGQRQRQKKNVL